MRHLLVLMSLLVFCSPLHTQDADDYALINKGRQQLSEKEYAGAIESFGKALERYPAIGDYLLLWLAETHTQEGLHEESLATLRTLRERYPSSSLVKKVRAMEITEAGAAGLDQGLLFESYLKDYPGDSSIKFAYAEWLKKNGCPEKALPLMKEIFRGAGPYSSKARSVLKDDDLSTEDLTAYAINLMGRLNFRGAEKVLRSCLEKSEGPEKKEVLRQLAMSLFRQKKYTEAADLFRQAEDRYLEIRSRYRAGEKKAVREAIVEMIESGESKFGAILLAVAGDMRREDNADEALRIYSAIEKKLPARTEDALWGAAWTYYLKDDYGKSSEILNKLFQTYGNTKYLYWQRRSEEQKGLVSVRPFETGDRPAPDFYQILLTLKTMQGASPAAAAIASPSPEPSLLLRKNQIVPGKIERIEILLALGLQREAVAEMSYISRTTSSPEDLLYLCTKMKEIGEYRLAALTAGKLPYSSPIKNFLYPLAYWESVEPLSVRNSVDPLLVLAIIREESRFDKEALSPAGAIGLMQLMPQTALTLEKSIKAGIRDEDDLRDVRKNLSAGIYYLSRLIKEFGGYPQAIAAYNAGEPAVRKWLGQGRYEYADEFIEDIPYEETRNYVKRVLTSYYEYTRTVFPDRKSIEFLPGKL
jgi:soluble lytic murein transglycosylase